MRTKFPFDTIEPVAKGEFGGDAFQRMTSASGTILWEFKRTHNWSDGWLTKLREDQRTAKAEAAVLVSQAPPRGVETFDYPGKDLNFTSDAFNVEHVLPQNPQQG